MSRRYDEWLTGPVWQVAPLTFPSDAEFDQVIVSASLCFSVKERVWGDVMLTYGWMPDEQGVDSPAYHSVGEPALPLADYEPGTPHEIALGAFPLSRGAGGAYVIGRDLSHPSDTEPEIDAIRFHSIGFVISEGAEDHVGISA
jgi:hypothetical protein